MIDADISERRSIGYRLGEATAEAVVVVFYAALAWLLTDKVHLPAPVVVTALVVACVLRTDHHR